MVEGARGAGIGALVVAMACALGACTGAIKPDARVQGDASRIEGIGRVTVAMSPDAAKQLADSPQFNRDELASYLRRRLEGKGLIGIDASHRVDIVITDLRVRGVFAAVMFGFMAGDDHVNGRVRILDERNVAIRSFDVQASYAFGGAAGGDGMRMNWLYDKFSELAIGELEKVIRPPRVAAVAPPASAASGASMAASMSASTVASVAVPVVADARARLPRIDPSTSIDRVDAVPGLDERGRTVYRDWLTRRSPRAFVIAAGGRVNATWGRNPKDPMDPRDPAERALKQCRAAGRVACTLYAVDERVVYNPDAPEMETTAP